MEFNHLINQISEMQEKEMIEDILRHDIKSTPYVVKEITVQDCVQDFKWGFKLHYCKNINETRAFNENSLILDFSNISPEEIKEKYNKKYNN